MFSFSANGPNLPMVQSERVQALGKAKRLCQVSVHHTVVNTRVCTDHIMFSVQHPTVLSNSLQLCNPSFVFNLLVLDYFHSVMM